MNRAVITGLVICCTFFGCKVSGVTQEKNDPKACTSNTLAKLYIPSSSVVLQTWTIMSGRCTCFSYSDGKIVYNPSKPCDNLLLCRMLHNMALMHQLHFNMLNSLHSNLQAESQVQDVKTSGLALKGQRAKSGITYSPKATSNINLACLSKLLQKEVPSLIMKLQELLCLFQQGKDEHNEALYKEFLKQLNIVLKDAGCSLDEVLGTKDTLEQITDNAGKIADRLVFEILRIADDLKITGKLLNIACKLLGKTLTGLSGLLGKIDLNLDLGLKTIVGGLLG
ncbi:uncharacterized protein [Hyperolius riggenbachi]|uniref:uncharacterized protein n=1 Tax=Hyperolius riggenbachi TaxID=752182 RepID=UPI0035A2DBB5